MTDRLSRAEREAQTEALRRVHASALGYQPFRMKPVHLATGFLLALTGQSRRLEWLNKAAIPKSAPKRGTQAEDQYVAEALLPILAEHGTVQEDLNLEAFRALRAHLNAAFNNDGASLGPVFHPHKTFGSDFSAPDASYLSPYSKNHGYAGSFVLRVLESTGNGQAFLDFARKILDGPAPPQSELGAPLVDEEPDDWEDDYEEFLGILPSDRIAYAAELMAPQTKSLLRLAETLVERQSVYSLRYLILGLCSWLFLYMMRRDGNEPLLFIDAQQGQNSRVRAQSRASYARELSLFSQSYERWFEAHSEALPLEDWERFRTSHDARQILEDHFRDLGVRIGFVQPRAPVAKRKHVELQADSLRVLALSLLAPNEVLTLAEFAARLRETWCVCVGADGNDAELLQAKRYSPLDVDDDLEPNASAFRALLVRLGLAVEPSDGLTLCAIEAEELI
jgi:hypothetical protein